MTTDTTTRLILGTLAGVLVILAWMLYWLGAMYFTIRKGMNEIIEGLASIDANLERAAKHGDDQAS